MEKLIRRIKEVIQVLRYGEPKPTTVRLHQQRNARRPNGRPLPRARR